MSQHLVPGDLLFYPARPDNRTEQVIARATHGPFCHVAIVSRGGDLALPGGGGGQMIEARSRRGIVRSPLRADAQTACAPLGDTLNPFGLVRATKWLETQVGHPYGWLDIAADALGLVLPSTPFLVAPSQLDCSALATTFLLVAGYPLPDALVVSPHTVSPNALARALGILK